MFRQSNLIKYLSLFISWLSFILCESLLKISYYVQVIMILSCNGCLSWGGGQQRRGKPHKINPNRRESLAVLIKSQYSVFSPNHQFSKSFC